MKPSSADPAAEGIVLNPYAVVVALFVSAGSVFAAGAVRPEAALVLPAAALGLWAVGVALVYERIGLWMAIAGGVLVLNAGQGAGVLHYGYAVFLLLFLTGWYGRRLGSVKFIRDMADVAALATLAAYFVSALAGALFSEQFRVVVSEVVNLLPLTLYFPVREAVARSGRGAEVVFAALLVLGLLTSFRAMWTTHVLLSEVEALWQVLRVRAPGGEVPIMTGFVLAVVALARAKDTRSKGIAVVLLGVLLTGLLLTKSRGYWLGAGVGILAAWTLAPQVARAQMTLWGSIAFIVSITAGLILVGDLLVTLALGISERLLSITDAVAVDPSMLNRFNESRAVWSQVWESPVLGHGLGVQYSYYSLESEGTRIHNYIHNGFAALWFKQGALGFVSTMALWAIGIWRATCLVRNARVTMSSRLLALGVGAALVANVVPAYTSSPFYSMVIVLTTTTLIGLSNGLYQRHGSPDGPLRLHDPRAAATGA